MAVLFCIVNSLIVLNYHLTEVITLKPWQYDTNVEVIDKKDTYWGNILFECLLYSTVWSKIVYNPVNKYILYHTVAEIFTRDTLLW